MQERSAALLFVAALALASPLLALGCPGNACFLKICQGSRCRCSISSCGDGAAFDTKQGRCRCLKDFIPLAGQCMTGAQANAYCGVGRHFENGGCVANQCGPADELDQSTGLCVPRERVNQVATGMGVQVGEGQKLGCPPGQKLILDGNVAACVPLSQTCARDETWNGQACVKVVQCPTGQIWDTALATCVQYAKGSDADELVVDVNQWAYSNFGPNGGMGTASFCGAFAKKPLSFGLVEGATAFVRVNIAMSFPDGEIAKGVIQTSTTFEASGNPVPARGAAEVGMVAQNTFTTLVLGGGRSSLPSAGTIVRCAVINAGKPQPVPATGGL
jgi:hypothetical protein